jgi:hypothetical protein
MRPCEAVLLNEFDLEVGAGLGELAGKAVAYWSDGH